MKSSLRVAAGLAAASVGLLAVGVVPASAVTKPPFPVDSIMKNDLKLRAPVASGLNLGGSSFDFPLAQAAETQWNADTHQAPFSPYASTKSGVGRSNMLSGAYNIGFSDFPLNIGGNVDVGPGSSYPSLTTANFVQVPVVLGGVAIIYHWGSLATAQLGAAINKYGFVLNGPTLGKIFKGTITQWDDANIKATNPHLATLLPHAPINLVSRTSGSGTTFMFTDYLSKVDHGDFPAATSAAFSAAALTGANSAAVDNQVRNTDGAIGYVEFGYALANNNPQFRLINASHRVVKLNAGGIAAAASIGLSYINHHGGFNTNSTAGFSINNMVGPTVWPISGFSYGIVYKNQSAAPSPNKSAAIAEVKFLDFLSHQGIGKTAATKFGQNLAISQGFAPMPLTMQKLARTLLLKVTFGGAKVLSATN
jgi:phosphate transport system substrate-binding protein